MKEAEQAMKEKSSLDARVSVLEECQISSKPHITFHITMHLLGRGNISRTIFCIFYVPLWVVPALLAYRRLE